MKPFLKLKFILIFVSIASACGCEISKGSRVLLVLLFAPSIALASDFTALFVLFVELPILGASLLFLPVCFYAPKPGLVLSSLLFIGSLFVIGWASGGYMDDAGGFLLSSLLVDVAGIMIALKKINTAREHGN